MIKILKKRNPNISIKKILTDLGFNSTNVVKLEKGENSQNYKFVSDQENYIIKLQNTPLTNNQINYLNKLANLKLIPKIEIIKPSYLISKYIDSKTLSEYLSKNFDKLSIKQLQTIYNNLNKIIQKWHKFGFVHGDLHDDNVLITKNHEIYLIDPNIDYDLEKYHDLSYLEDTKYNFGI